MDYGIPYQVGSLDCLDCSQIGLLRLRLPIMSGLSYLPGLYNVFQSVLSVRSGCTDWIDWAGLTGWTDWSGQTEWTDWNDWNNWTDWTYWTDQTD